jgi:hypothetical protein
MRRNASTRLGAIAVVFLAAIALSSCCGKSVVPVEVEPCPVMTEAMLLEIGVSDSLAAVYVADEIIPYCAGIDAM